MFYIYENSIYLNLLYIDMHKLKNILTQLSTHKFIINIKIKKQLYWNSLLYKVIVTELKIGWVFHFY